MQLLSPILLHKRSVHPVTNDDRTYAYQGSVQPPSGECSSKSSGRPISRIQLGCLWHFIGRPLYMYPPLRRRSKNWLQSCPPFLERSKVDEFPTRIRPFRAREMRTLRRSGELMNPMKLRGFERQRLATIMSLSSPW